VGWRSVVFVSKLFKFRQVLSPLGGMAIPRTGGPLLRGLSVLSPLGGMAIIKAYENKEKVKAVLSPPCGMAINLLFFFLLRF
jgi:hypothetical protein